MIFLSGLEKCFFKALNRRDLVFREPVTSVQQLQSITDDIKIRVLALGPCSAQTEPFPLKHMETELSEIMRITYVRVCFFLRWDFMLYYENTKRSNTNSVLEGTGT